MPAEKRKPRNAPLLNDQQPKKPKASVDTPRTSAQTATQTSRQNLTLGDWLTVFAYVDAHPSVPQKDVVNHFKTLETGTLIFTQPTLSRKLKDRAGVENRINDNPSALSSKRPRVVTRPDVEKALVLWVRHMEAKGEQFNGQMLKEKRGKFEELLNVPDAEKLAGDGWLPSFCRVYKIRENRRRVFETPPTLDEFPELKEVETTPDSTADILQVEGPTRGDEAIVAEVVREMEEKKNQAIEVDSDEEDEPDEPAISRSEALNLCDKLMEACLQHGDTSSDLPLNLLTHLRHFRASLRREELLHVQQTTLDAFVTRQSNQTPEAST